MVAANTQTYTLLKEHEHNGAVIPAGTAIALTPEQWHLLHMHGVVSTDPVAAAE